MIARKLKLLNTENTILIEEVSFEAIDLDKVKHKTLKNAKKYGFIILVNTLRLSIKTSYLLKQNWKKTKIRIIYIIDKISSKRKNANEREVSVFLKKVSEYKEKIKEITDHIKEEEGIK
jgi:hypothetical protein